MKSILYTCCLFAITFTYAQDTTNTIDNQFETLINESNKYQDFKVVKLSKLQELKSNTAAYIGSLNSEISKLQADINAQNEKISNLDKTLNETKDSLALVNEEKASISFLGMQLQKGTYNTIVWSIIAVILFGLGFFILQFKNSNAQTVIAKDNLRATEAELEELRRKSLEKEQKLGRMLQDERNKHSRVQHA